MRQIEKKEPLLKGPYLRKIRDWAHADQPREKLVRRGSAVLTEAELLGILIGSGTKNVNAVGLAQLIMKHYDNNLNLLAKCSIKELQRFEGIGEAKAIMIASAIELGRRRATQDITKRPKFRDSSSVYHFIRSELSGKPLEEFWIVLVNKANYLIKKQFISSGGLDATLADPKIIFRAALDHQASGVVLIHNHPSGNPEPSSSDMHLTKKLIEGGKFLDITVLDHIIVAGDTYFSFVDDKLLF